MSQDTTRTLRLAGRQALRRVTGLIRCADCGRASIMPGGAVQVRYAEGVGGFAGLSTCGRVWLCPCCNAKVMARRAVEVGAVLTWATAHGCRVIWGSLTCRHNSASDLGELLDVQTAAWRYVVSSRAWRDASATDTVRHQHVDDCPWDCERVRDTVLSTRPGRVGYIRASEVTIGGNGWHPHFHPIILYRGTQEAAQVFADTVVDRWVHGVERAGGEAEREGAQQLRVLDQGEWIDELSGYIVKGTFDAVKLALEAVWSQSKSGRGRVEGTVSHWSLLARLEADGGDRNAARRWGQLEAAAGEHRMITWSRGLRRHAGIGDEADDETVAAEELGSAEDCVAVITPAGWRVVRDEPAVLGLLLSQLEGHGVEGLTVMLDAYGVEWTTVEGLAAWVATDQGDAGPVSKWPIQVQETGWAARAVGDPITVWAEPEAMSLMLAPVIGKSRPASVFDSRRDDDFWLHFDYSQAPPGLDAAAPAVNRS